MNARSLEPYSNLRSIEPHTDSIIHFLISMQGSLSIGWGFQEEPCDMKWYHYERTAMISHLYEYYLSCTFTFLKEKAIIMYDSFYLQSLCEFESKIISINLKI